MTHIGDYDLLYRLGTGGMGNVYLARRRNESGLHRLFAVKAMHAVLSADVEFANMFLDEAHIASQLHHINVVGIVDLGRYAGRLFLVMDYVEGPTLAQMMSAATERPPGLVCSIVIDMLHGLHAAHSLSSESGERLDLVHRDVSPSNILVGTDGVARLTDFGIAKARMRRTSTSPGVRKGKLSYSAPEQITNPGGEDSRVDVFAAGVVLWNALTGARLFEGENEASVILSVITRPIPPPSEVGLRPPACLDRVCLRALSRDPADRYSSAAEMAEDLRRVTRANDLMAGPEQVAEWVARLFGEELAQRRAAIRATASGTDPGAIAGSLAFGSGLNAPELEVDYVDLSVSSGDAAESSAMPAPRSKRRAIVGLLAVAACAAAVAAGINAYSRNAARAPAPPSPGAQRPALSPAAIDARGAAVVVEPTAPASGAGSATGAPTGASAAGAASTDGDAASTETSAPGVAARGQTTTAVTNIDRDAGGDEAESEEEQEARRQTASKSQRRRKPTPPRPRAAQVRTEEAAAAEPPAPAPPPTASEPATRPEPGETIETNPYLRRGGPKDR